MQIPIDVVATLVGKYYIRRAHVILPSITVCLKRRAVHEIFGDASSYERSAIAMWIGTRDVVLSVNAPYARAATREEMCVLQGIYMSAMLHACV